MNIKVRYREVIFKIIAVEISLKQKISNKIGRVMGQLTTLRNDAKYFYQVIL